MSRAEKIERAKQLRADGLSYRGIGERLGCSRTTAARLVVAPTSEQPKFCPGCDADLTGTHAKTKWCSERCRKRTVYSGECIDCGGRTHGVASGKSRATKRCDDCARTRNAERNELLVEMWEAGEPAWYIAEKLGVTAEAVTSWVNSARQRQGRPIPFHRAGNRDRWEQIEKLWREGWTSAEIGERVGLSATGVASRIQNMRKAGIDLPYRQEVA